MLGYISENRYNDVSDVPTMVHATLQTPDIEKYDLSSLRLILYAGSSMPVELLKRALRCSAIAVFAQLYGQTESGPFTTVLKPETISWTGRKEWWRGLHRRDGPHLTTNYVLSMTTIKHPHWEGR